MRPTKSEYLLLVAEAVAKRATCPRRTVGCVLADKQARILATGYNGGLRGDAHCGVDGMGCAGLHDKPGQPSRCEAVHAELNALLQCRHREEVVFVACTTSPCLACARALVQGLVNLEKVFYRDAYCNTEGLELLERRRVRCEQVKGGG